MKFNNILLKSNTKILKKYIKSNSMYLKNPNPQDHCIGTSPRLSFHIYFYFFFFYIFLYNTVLFGIWFYFLFFSFLILYDNFDSLFHNCSIVPFPVHFKEIPSGTYISSLYIIQNIFEYGMKWLFRHLGNRSAKHLTFHSCATSVVYHVSPWSSRREARGLLKIS